MSRARRRGDRASIQQITNEADIGFGSFYNHFDSKDQLFATGSHEVMRRRSGRSRKPHRREAADSPIRGPS